MFLYIFELCLSIFVFLLLFLVSGHELKGLMAYFSLEMEEVNFPLMTLVDYRGFRLVAISVLPVGKGRFNFFCFIFLFFFSFFYFGL